MPPENTQRIAPDDEAYWSGIRAQYRLSNEFINLENGMFGVPAAPVLDACAAHERAVYAEGTYFLRNRYPERLRQVTRSLAEFAGVSPDEVAVVRNPTEGMNILIQGYPFRDGDELLIGNQDYASVEETVKMMAQRGRFTINQVVQPFQVDSDEQLVSLYERAITPRTRAIILTHVLHRTGQILPVARIAAMARARGVDVLLDAAHSFAHLAYRIPDLGCDFVVGHLHKWLGVPLGAGLLYVRKERIADISPLFGDVSHAAGDIGKLAHFGTTPPGPVLAIEDAIAFHLAIGSANKEARLRYLKDCWVDRVRSFRRIEMLVPEASARSGAIAAFRVADMDGQAVVNYLMEQHRIFTCAPELGGERFVRVTPALHNGPEDLEKLVVALERFD
ncbi:aminotransferase class V-fold PLP-dependent enzyme [Noviherbaspirillum galbum]|uniref:Aminotransferase class V-fold PLP-dependent enzyme n=1 Tax=Noviherbaspirillum galbum TaxID=2709383 RepID=A0A6B3SU67_9BURK|nr:aminotransferase class V-fold PLP-dependent enzyme [Noviherbaspirillum galbum]NEX64267.1 aminotransferase class V-fold PLP-dependent enzyme [Noviherbaspirillum galbum]